MRLVLLTLLLTLLLVGCGDGDMTRAFDCSTKPPTQLISTQQGHYIEPKCEEHR